MITSTEIFHDKMRTLEWAGYTFQIHNRNWTKPDKKTITAYDFCFFTLESLEKFIKEKGK